MSKKSRRRNRRLLTALAALGGAAMLAGRGKKPNMDIPDRNRGMMPTGIDKKISDVYPDAIMRGGKGVKQGFKTTSANVQKGLIEPPGLFNQGVVKFEKPVSIIPKKKFKSSAEVQREVLANKAANAQRAQTFDQERFKFPVEVFQDSMLGDTREIAAKKGGRIVKGEKTAVRKKINRIQIKGFGKARKYWENQ